LQNYSCTNVITASLQWKKLAIIVNKNDCENVSEAVKVIVILIVKMATSMGSVSKSVIVSCRNGLVSFLV